jgi:hypothetical protein
MTTANVKPITRRGKATSHRSGKVSMSSKAMGQQSTNNKHHNTRPINKRITLGFGVQYEARNIPPSTVALRGLHAAFFARVAKATRKN